MPGRWDGVTTAGQKKEGRRLLWDDSKPQSDAPPEVNNVSATAVEDGPEDDLIDPPIAQRLLHTSEDSAAE